ncbi:MAG: energy transducer TonB, partial [Proteobacteria bacterium]|nr:energy transducer TonB [Pseudomonadota bacterium]
KASEKFKYKPRVVDGEAIEVAGVQNKFTYELEN